MSMHVDFVVIGTTKGGTTTLYDDLVHHSNARLVPKDFNLLSGDESLEAPIDMSRSGPIGEVCTRYSDRATFPAAAARARARWGPGLRVIFTLRDPVRRAISHHHHSLNHGLVSDDFEQAIEQDPSILDIGRYAFQVQPWLDEFPLEQVMVVGFERFIAERGVVLAEICDFVGANKLSEPDPLAVSNASSQTRVARGLWHRLSAARLYRHRLHRLVPDRLREAAKRFLLSSPLPAPEVTKGADLGRYYAVDHATLRQIFGAEFDAIAERWGGE